MTYEVSLVVSRSKVAPIKMVTLPRLELMGAALCARLIVFSRTALQLPENVPFYCWTDSQVTLSWIKGDPHRWKTFVQNRVVEIQSLTSPSHWYHCPGRDNPADLLSRGVYAEQLVSSDIWLHGPSWLSQSSESFPDGKSDIIHSSDYFHEESVLSCIDLNPLPKVFQFENWGTFSKICNIVGWVLRFCHNLRHPDARCFSGLTVDELAVAKMKVYYYVQQEAYSMEFQALTLGKPLPKGSSLCK